MKYIFLNLKRFDIPSELGGLNRLKDTTKWAESIIEGIDKGIKKYENEASFVSFFPESYILSAASSKNDNSIINIGSQSVHWGDVEKGGNFGAFTSGRTAKSMKCIGCNWTIIGHCEERRDLKYILDKSGTADKAAVSKILNEKIKAAINAGLKVLYCVGETQDEQPHKYDVLKEQLEAGLDSVDTSKVVIGYEPVWAIGPGKTPPGAEYISDIAGYIKSVINVPVVYGGGLKQANAEMLASIEEIDGGLIALTRFTGDIGFYPEEYLDIVKLYL